MRSVARRTVGRLPRSDRLIRAYLGARARAAIRELAELDSAPARALATSLADTFSGRATAPERRWFDRIEGRRAALCASSALVEALDTDGRSTTVPVAVDVERSSKAAVWGQLMFRTIRAFEPRKGLELGTCYGLSAAYQAAALALVGDGHVTTLEGSHDRAEVARRGLSELELGNVEIVEGWFDDTLDVVVDTIAPVDWVFIDGHHEGPATVDYFRRIVRRAAPESIFVLDDIRWSESMAGAWREVTAHPTVAASVDLGSVGFLIIDSTDRPPVHLTISARGLDGAGLATQ